MAQAGRDCVPRFVTVSVVEQDSLPNQPAPLQAVPAGKGEPSRVLTGQCIFGTHAANQYEGIDNTFV
jgi:hypothetical protein